MSDEPGASGAETSGRDWVDVGSTVLLALATVAIAWSSYQANRWSGEQSIAFSAASAARVESGKAAARAGQLTQIDVTLFAQWVDAYSREETELSDFYRARFRDEFKPAMDAWVATRPRTNPDAPKSPFAMPEYELAEQKNADRLVLQAEAQTNLAKRNNQRSDNYVLCVVLFAASLFFAGISTKVEPDGNRLVVLVLGYVVFFGTLAWILSFPVSFSV